jgi:predicted metal-binding protein
MIYNIHTINIDPMFQKLCRQSYPGHTKGCPNYGKKKGCPPQQKLFFDIFDQDFYLIYTEFDLATHVKKMRKKHSDWTDRQLYCCLYWQGTARKNLKAEITRAKKMLPHHHITTCPEAMGVNVTDLMEDNADIELEWPPKTTTYQVAIAGLKKS